MDWSAYDDGLDQIARATGANGAVVVDARPGEFVMVGLITGTVMVVEQEDWCRTPAILEVVYSTRRAVA